MREIYRDNQIYTRSVYVGSRRPSKRYGFFKFLCDVSLTFLTGGMWLIWILVREMRR